MTPDEVRAAAGELYSFHQRFAPLFGYQPAQDHALAYLRGLLQHDGRKNAEAIALVFDTDQPRAVQQFLTDSPWDYRAVQHELQAVFAQELVPSTATWGLGTVGVLDDSGFPKKGDHSAGVQRQWCGRLGKKDNCQVGVFLVGVTPAGSALLDHQLYLPEDWVLDPQRCRQAGVPRRVTFRTKPQLGLDLHARVEAAGHVRCDWLTCDEGYGRDGAFLAELERRRQRYVAEVPVTTTVWTLDPATQVPEYSGRGRRPQRPVRDSVRSVVAVAEALAASSWEVLCLRAGSGEPVTYEFAAVRVWAMREQGPGPAVWLLVRRPLGGGKPEEVKYYLSNAPTQTPLATLALVSGCRVRVEEHLQDSKTYLGMAQYEVRSWAGWHHHMTLVALAHLLVSRVRLRLQKKKSGLSLDLAVRLLKAALPQPVRSVEEALRIVAYHLHRNAVAQRSHAHRWRARHPGVQAEPLVKTFSLPIMC
jgi:SRSO17 transposase